MESTYEQRVAEAAAWLDEQNPGWVNMINLDILNLADGTDCVLGQIYGYFNKAPKKVGMFRFFHAFCETDPEGRTTEAWRNLILARRANEIVARGGLTKEAEHNLLVLSA